jgi:hypothetical protein
MQMWAFVDVVAAERLVGGIGTGAGVVHYAMQKVA